MLATLALRLEMRLLGTQEKANPCHISHAGSALPPLPSTTPRAPSRDVLGTCSATLADVKQRQWRAEERPEQPKAWQPPCLLLAPDCPTFHPVRSPPVPLTSRPDRLVWITSTKENEA